MGSINSVVDLYGRGGSTWLLLRGVSGGSVTAEHETLLLLGVGKQKEVRPVSVLQSVVSGNIVWHIPVNKHRYHL